MSIQEIYQKYKSVLEDDALFYAVIIVCIAVASFGLGRYSIHSQAPVSAPVVSVSESSVSQNVQRAEVAKEGQYVASKNGTRYYLLWCGGVSRINEENKVYFDTEAEALAQGYTPATNCDGLAGE